MHLNVSIPFILILEEQLLNLVFLFEAQCIICKVQNIKFISVLTFRVLIDLSENRVSLR